MRIERIINKINIKPTDKKMKKAAEMVKTAEEFPKKIIFENKADFNAGKFEKADKVGIKF